MIPVSNCPSNRPKPRPREHTTKPRSTTKTTPINLDILFGPDRSEIYHESEFCFHYDGGSLFRVKFLIEESQFFKYCGNAQVTGIQHCAKEAYRLRLTGKIIACLANAKTSEIFPFTATYDAMSHHGTIRITIP